jgi:MFS family permease
VLSSIRTCAAPLAVAAFLVIANGLSGTAFAMELSSRGITGTRLGALLAASHLGMLLGAAVAAWLGSRVPARSLAFVGALAASLASLSLAHSPDSLWFVIRIIQGGGAIWVFVACESWLGAKPGHVRPFGFALYMLVNQLGLALGQLGVDSSNGGFTSALILSAAIYATGLLFLPRRDDALVPVSDAALPRVRIASSRILAAAVASGVFVGAVLSTGPLFVAQSGHSHVAGSFIACVVMAGVLLQLPLARLSGPYGSDCLTLWSAAALVFVGLAAAFATPQSSLSLHIVGSAMGAFGFLLYPLAAGRALADALPHERQGTSGQLLLAYGAGATCAPSLVILFGSSPRGFPLVVALSGLIAWGSAVGVASRRRVAPAR